MTEVFWKSLYSTVLNHKWPHHILHYSKSFYKTNCNFTNKLFVLTVLIHGLILCVCIHMCACMCARTHTHTHTHTHTYMCVCVCVCVYIHIYIYIYIYIYICKTAPALESWVGTSEAGIVLILTHFLWRAHVETAFKWEPFNRLCLQYCVTFTGTVCSALRRSSKRSVLYTLGRRCITVMEMQIVCGGWSYAVVFLYRIAILRYYIRINAIAIDRVTVNSEFKLSIM